jgi:hypothetical protein
MKASVAQVNRQILRPEFPCSVLLIPHLKFSFEFACEIPAQGYRHQLYSVRLLPSRTSFPIHDSSSNNSMTAVLDRRQCGRVPPDTPVLQIPCDYLVLRESGEKGRLPYQHVDVELAKARELVIACEDRSHRELLRRCDVL